MTTEENSDASSNPHLGGGGTPEEARQKNRAKDRGPRDRVDRGAGKDEDAEPDRLPRRPAQLGHGLHDVRLNDNLRDAVPQHEQDDQATEAASESRPCRPPSPCRRPGPFEPSFA